MVISIETDRGLVVWALVTSGYNVFAVNPMSTSRYRDRHSSSGAKSDTGDAKKVADMVRTDRHNHRTVAGDSELAEAVTILARAHQSMIWTRGRHTNYLRSTLREFYPAALVAFPDLVSSDAIEVLRLAPTPSIGAGLPRSKIAAALKRGGVSAGSTSVPRRSSSLCGPRNSRDRPSWRRPWAIPSAPPSPSSGP